MKTLMDKFTTLALCVAMLLGPALPATADPCGMVPPLWLGDGAPITRVGAQKTYVFYKDGIETFVIRPGFSGRIDQFGMLIPFPSPPSMRKVAEDVFEHIGAAVDPPEVLVDLRPRPPLVCCDMAAGTRAKRSAGLAFPQAESEVRVLRQEAVGMYEVAVLDAGSARALKAWMDDHDFRYPDGMDRTCDEYIEAGWCFVAVRARVGSKSASDPRPGMHSVDPSLPTGAGFDGHVQAMGFRFHSDELVVPMRLSAFNPGELRNVVYVLTDGPKRIANLPAEHVVRQVEGSVLLDHLTRPLPLRVLGGDLEDIPEWRLKNLPAERDPTPHNGIARDLFASDLLAAAHGRLVHPHEEHEKTLLEIGERLGLRHPGMDALHREALAEERDAAVAESLRGLRGMTLTVIDGDFEREVLAAENLRFAEYRMDAERNDPKRYDARHLGPAPVQAGWVDGGFPGSWPTHFLPGLGDLLPSPSRPAAVVLLALSVLGAVRLLRRGVRPRHLGVAAVLCLILHPFGPIAAAGPMSRTAPGAMEVFGPLLSPLDAESENASLETRVPRRCGVEPPRVPEEDTVARLLEEALHAPELVDRGWAIVALADLGGDEARGALETAARTSPSNLVRTWARAARIRTAATGADLLELTRSQLHEPTLERPLRQRWLALLAGPEPESAVSLDQVLEAAALGGPLQSALIPAVLEADASALVDVMVRSASTPARNFAAASLATLEGQGRPGIPRTVIEALRFEACDLSPDLSPAWDGGALFLPALQWTKEDARELCRELLAWYVWADSNDHRELCTQLHNNLRSLALARAAGYSSPGWQETGVDEWLRIWARAFGVREVADLLLEQGLSQTWHYQHFLRDLMRERGE